jgi:hypothetical protein
MAAQRHRSSAPCSNLLRDSLDLHLEAFGVMNRVDANGGRYTMEFKTKAAFTEWANDQTLAAIAPTTKGRLA